MFDITFLGDLRKRLENVSQSVYDYGYYFKALALADSYNFLIKLADERTSQHPEVVRVPEMREILLQHLRTSYNQHINLEHEQIFNPTILGGEFALRQWQEAGYRPKARRTTKNYYTRLQYWKSIYDNQPMRVQLASANKKYGTATLTNKSSPWPRTGEDIFGPAQSRLYYEVRVKDRSGQIITYEDVIAKRNLGFGATTNKLIPFWIVLNYGSDFSIQPGYPVTPALHFIEDAERTIVPNTAKMADAFSEFMLYILEAEDTARTDFTIVEAWARSNVKLTQGTLDPSAVALDLVYGLPF